MSQVYVVFYNDTATTEIYTLSLHDARPIYVPTGLLRDLEAAGVVVRPGPDALVHAQDKAVMRDRLTALGAPCPAYRVVTDRSEEHTSELQSRQYLVCRLLLEKKKPQPPLIH